MYIVRQQMVKDCSTAGEELFQVARFWQPHRMPHAIAQFQLNE